MRFTIAEILTATGGTLFAPSSDPTSAESVAVDSVAIDSREVARGGLFVALVADRDGHHFLEDAAMAGAAAALVLGPDAECALPQVVVSDTGVALAALGRAARARLTGSVIGITGSVGKTSTKDLLAAVCARAGSFAASAKSLNNELGVPLTLLNAPGEAERVVIEMGARGPGHIRHLCEVAAPTIGVVTRVVPAHTEQFGSLAATAAAKSELIEMVPPDGTAILNADDPLVAAMASVAVAPVLTFGDLGEVRAGSVRVDGALRVSFEMLTPWGSAPVRLGIRGRHHVANALAAAAAALTTGIDLAEVAAGLGHSELSPWRMELATAPTGGLVLNDAYNANPASVRAALEALLELPADRRVAVLGVMAELGDSEAAEHAAIAAFAAEQGIELIAFGTDLYGPRGLATIEEVIRLQPAPHEGEAILVKGSRVAGLERLAAEWTSPSPG